MTAVIEAMPSKREQVLAASPAVPDARDEAVKTAILQALAYADVFDWPLTPAEVHRWLPLQATVEEVGAALRRLLSGPGTVEASGGYLALAGRGRLAERRRWCETISRSLWPAALRCARAVAALPFVRLVAVTGSLAVDAATHDADVDLLVVTADGRLWLTRALTMGVVRTASLAGLGVCPNYLLGESDLALAERNLFTAHELTQMVPIGDSPLHAGFLQRNAWYREFLPNALPVSPVAPSAKADRPGPLLRRVAEAVLGLQAVDRVERWEMHRKVARLSAASDSPEVRYDAACCKGHADAHGRRVLAAYEDRVRGLGCI